MTLPPDAAVVRFRADLARVARAAGVTEAPLALAVSGGADSMAMLVLAAVAFPGRVAAATFDHRLRAASADEAAMVARVCAGLDVAHVTLAPDAPISGNSIQMRAREARYAALHRWAGDRPLLTAHHADDQAETLLMRLNRASGLSGLAAIRGWRRSEAGVVLRPLLTWRRAELRGVAAAVPFVDDPSNDDPRYDRTRIRALLAATPGLDVPALAASAGWLAEAEEVVARQAALLWSERWSGPQRPFDIAGEPRELRRRLARRAIAESRRAFAIALPAFGESANVEALLDALEGGRAAVQGGVKVTPGRDGWAFAAAPARRSH